MKKLLPAILCCAFLYTDAQIRIDGNFPFQTDPAKQYSLYIPSGYNASVPHRMMLGLHPFNTATWNSISWCDTLTAFAETNNLILVCPDGGVDGMIDDPIDTAFTSALLDSMLLWYNIDTQKIYVMGFSVGGKTTYTYGLFHSWRFGGFIPIGAAVNGTTEVTGLIQNANGKPFFLVHGALDSPSIRFYPIRSALISNNAIEKDTLMPGIGHTINFPNRNLILSIAYHWIDSVNCAQLTTSINESIREKIFQIFPNPASENISVTFPESQNQKAQIQIFNAMGMLLKEISVTQSAQINIEDLPSGLYFVEVRTDKATIRTKIIKI